MAVIVADTFTRTDSTNTVGASETGAVTPTVHTGTWGISTNRLYASALTSLAGLISWECGTPNVDITLDIPVNHSSQADGIAFLISSPTDYWKFAPGAAATSQWVVQKVNSSSSNPTPLLIGAQAGASAAMTGIRVVIYSGEAAFYWGGTLVGRLDLTQFGPVTATKHGVGVTAGSTSTRYDNLSISDSSAIAHSNSSVFVYKGRDTKTIDAGSVA